MSNFLRPFYNCQKQKVKNIKDSVHSIDILYPALSSLIRIEMNIQTVTEHKLKANVFKTFLKKSCQIILLKFSSDASC